MCVPPKTWNIAREPLLVAIYLKRHPYSKEASRPQRKQLLPLVLKEAISKEAIPKEVIRKEAIPKKAIPKEAIPKEAIPKEAINSFLFIKGSNCFLGDFLVSFCETLLCVERLACIFEMFGPIHMIIGHKHRRKETINGGLSAGRSYGGSYFPVWCYSKALQGLVADCEIV
jgi:hypothetical protein